MLVMGFDRWSDELGWWLPNATDCDGISADPITHTGQWRDGNGCVIRDELLFNHGSTEYRLVRDLVGTQYVYPVFIRNCDYFEANRSQGFTHVSAKAMSDVREGLAVMVLAMPLEGSSGSASYPDDHTILDSWCAAERLDRHQVFYVSGNQMIGDLSRGMRFTGVPFVGFHCWLDGCRDEPVGYDPIDGRDLLLCLNRIAKPHRSLVLCELEARGLRHRARHSYSAGGARVAASHMARIGRPDLAAVAAAIDAEIPIVADTDTISWNPAGTLHGEHYQGVFMDLVTETESKPGQVFFSEKIFKPISQGLPFMVVGGSGYLARLRDLGYLTFGGWWDESYDRAGDLHDRVAAIMAEIEVLSRHDTTRLRAMRRDMLPVLRHNMETFREQHSVCYGLSQDAPLHAAITAILDGRHG